MKRKVLLFIIAVSMIFSLGCWDRKEIENRGYVLGIAIDKYPPVPKGQEQGSEIEAKPEEEIELEMMELHEGEPSYAMTIQIPIVKKAFGSQTGSGGGSGGGGESKTWEITQIGNSFASMNREMQSRTSLSLYYEHLQVIIISEEVAKQGIENILDFYVRDPEMRRRVRLFISKGEAKRILDVVPRIEDYSAIYLALIPTNAVKNSRMIHKTDLGEVIKFTHEGYDYVLPMVQSTKDEIKANGGAVFKGDRMVGWLGELEVEALKFIRNLYMGGVLITEIPGEKGTFVIEVTKSKSKIKVINEDGMPKFDVHIKVDGNYAEELNAHTHGHLSNQHLVKLEKEAEKEIERICNELIDKAQKDLATDFLQLNHFIKTEQPKLWDNIKNDWDEVFPGLVIDVEVEVDINMIGIVK